MSEHIIVGQTSKLGLLIGVAADAVDACRFLERSPDGLRAACDLLLATTNDLASYLAERAVELESEQRG